MRDRCLVLASSTHLQFSSILPLPENEMQQLKNVVATEAMLLNKLTQMIGYVR
jgi:hypothetical protein